MSAKEFACNLQRAAAGLQMRIPLVNSLAQ
jgi:hypothetical protein